MLKKRWIVAWDDIGKAINGSGNRLYYKGMKDDEVDENDVLWMLFSEKFLGDQGSLSQYVDLRDVFLWVTHTLQQHPVFPNLNLGALTQVLL